MNIFPTRTDRVCDAMLRLIGAINLLFLLIFALSVSAMAGGARADAPSCDGTDLIEQMKLENPGGYEKLKAEAARVPNGTSVFFRIERAGVAPSWLLGTMHVADPRVLDMPAVAKTAYEAADTVVIETTEVLDQKKAAAVMMSRLDLTMLPKGKEISDYFTSAELAVIRDGLSARGIGFSSVKRMRPWLISTMVALPQCETLRARGGTATLDFRLAIDAKSAGKNVEGLETLASQLEAMASLSIEFHAQSLIATMKLGGSIEDVFETMIALYDRGETGMIWPFLRSVNEVFDIDAADGYAAFEEKLVIARNRIMADNAGPIIDRGNAFIAVGALHLPGEKGVVEYLRQAGYEVRPVR